MNLIDVHIDDESSGKKCQTCKCALCTCLKKWERKRDTKDCYVSA